MLPAFSFAIPIASIILISVPGPRINQGGFIVSVINQMRAQEVPSIVAEQRTENERTNIRWRHLQHHWLIVTIMTTPAMTKVAQARKYSACF
jgi:hypothetical protein